MILAFESIGASSAIADDVPFIHHRPYGDYHLSGLTSVSMDWRGIGFGLMAALGMADVVIIVDHPQKVWLCTPCLGECLCHAGGLVLVAVVGRS